MTQIFSSPVLILGARSDIGRAIAHAYAREGRRVMLAARDADALASDAADLRIRHDVAVDTVAFDVLDEDAPGFLAGLPVRPGTVVMVVGLLGDRDEGERNGAAADLVMRSNYNGPARYLLQAARLLGEAGGGTVIGISSVAGERGRGSNYIYGSAKAGLTAFLSGLRNRWHGRGVRVITIVPGFVRTAMTAGMKLPPLVTAGPAEVAAAVVKAERRGRTVVYVRGVWRPIMLIIGLIPERLFMRMSL